MSEREGLQGLSLCQPGLRGGPDCASLAHAAQHAVCAVFWDCLDFLLHRAICSTWLRPAHHQEQQMPQACQVVACLSAALMAQPAQTLRPSTLPCHSLSRHCHYLSSTAVAQQLVQLAQLLTGCLSAAAACGCARCIYQGHMTPALTCGPRPGGVEEASRQAVSETSRQADRQAV